MLLCAKQEQEKAYHKACITVGIIHEVHRCLNIAADFVRVTNWSEFNYRVGTTSSWCCSTYFELVPQRDNLS
jgi:hypothetical protein